MPISSLLVLNIEAGRLCVMREKAQVNAMAVAIAATFKSEVLDQYNAKTDEALKMTDVLSKIRQPQQANGSPGAADGSSSFKASQTAHTINELNKLNVLLAGG